MANKLYNETSIQAIANAIRAKNGSSNSYTVGQMASAIANIPTGDAEIVEKNYFQVTGGLNSRVVLSNTALRATDKVKIIFKDGRNQDNDVIVCTDRGGWDARNSLNVRVYQNKYIVGQTFTDIAYSKEEHTVEFDLSNGEMKFDSVILEATFNTSWTIGNNICIGKMSDLGSNAAAYIKAVQIYDENDELIHDFCPIDMQISNISNSYFFYDRIDCKFYGGSTESQSLDITT